MPYDLLEDLEWQEVAHGWVDHPMYYNWFWVWLNAEEQE